MKYIIIATLLFLSFKNIYPKEPDIIISAEKKIYDNKEKVWNLIGKPKLQNGKDIITSNTLKYFSEEHKALGTGNVKIFDYENAIELFGNKAEYFTDNKYAKLLENAKLISIKNNVIIKSKLIERINTKKYSVRENVEIEMDKENAIAKAQVADYELELNKITLKGKPIIIQEKAKYSANEIIIYTDTREVFLNGNAIITKGNKNIYAETINYYPKDKNRKAVLYGKSKIIEYSSEKSLLKGKPYRYINANEIVFYNTTPSKAILKGNPVINEFFIKKDDENINKTDKFLVYKRVAKAEVIKLIEGKENKYILIGNAQIYEPDKSVFANRIDYKDGREKVAILRGDAIFYLFNKNYNSIKDKVKLKGSAQTIKYFPDKKIVILDKEAKIIDNQKKYITAGYINYNTETEKGYAKEKAYFRKDKEYGLANLVEFLGEKKIILKGNAKYVTEEFNANADYIEYDDEKQEALLFGKARILDEEREAKGEKITYKKEKDKDTEIVNIKGKAILIGNEIEAKAENIFYKKEKRKELITLYMNSFIKRGKQIAEAEEIVYYTIPIPNSEDKKDEKILLKKNAKIIDPDMEIYGDNAEFYVFANNEEYKEKGEFLGNCQVIEKENQSQAFSDRIKYTKANTDREEIILKGNAEINDEEKTAYGDEIIYLPNFENGGEKYILKGSPYIQTVDSVTLGDSIELIETDKQIMNVIGNSKYFNTEERIDIFADIINYDNGDKVMRANGNAVFKDKNEEMTAFAENIIRYEKEKKSNALNSVKIIQGKKNIYGNQATYYEKNKELTVIDQAYIVEENNYAAGDKIILDTEERIVTVFGRREGQVETDK